MQIIPVHRDASEFCLREMQLIPPSFFSREASFISIKQIPFILVFLRA